MEDFHMFWWGWCQIRNQTSIGLFPGFDMRIGWKAEYILPEIHGNYMENENEGAVIMGGMCSDRVCYLFWFHLCNYQLLMFKMYGNYILWLDMSVIGQVLDAVEITKSTILKSCNPTPPLSSNIVPLTIFDLANLNFDHNVPIVYAFCGPTPSNSALKDGLSKLLDLYPHLTGRKTIDDRGNPCFSLNNAGARLIEARVKATLQEKLPLEATTNLSELYPTLKGVEELFQIQLNRYVCGGLVIGLAVHHRVCDGYSIGQLLSVWADMVRGSSTALTPYLDRAATCIPRSPPRCEFNHMETEFKVETSSSRDVNVQLSPAKITNIALHFTPHSIAELKSKVEGRSSTFENLLAHLWKKITIVRGVKDDEPTQVRIAVNGRARLRSDDLQTENFFGNMVLWAHPKLSAGELVSASHRHIVSVIHEAVSRVDGGYFRSFIDFGENLKREGVGAKELVRSAPKLWSTLSPNLEVDSLMGFKMDEIDFGSGAPIAVISPDLPVEGLMVFVPSHPDKGGVDVFVALLDDHVQALKSICYDVV